MDKLILSPLGHTWLLDVDGTLCVHNGYKNGGDKLLLGVKEFYSKIPAQDMIIIITARPETEKENLINFFKENGLRYDHIIFGAPLGERILINDSKPSGLQTAYAYNKKRDEKFLLSVEIDKDL